MKTSLERATKRSLISFLALASGLVLVAGSASCSPPATGDDAGDAGSVDSGRSDACTVNCGRDAGDGGTSVDTDAGDAGPPDCYSNPHTPEEIAKGCTNSFKLPMERVPPCATTGLPAPGAELPQECLPKDGGDPMLPDGSTCYRPDGG